MCMIKSLVRNQYIWYMWQRIYVPSQSAIIGYRHRERQGYMYSNRKVALDFISNVVINKTTTEEPIMLTHTSWRKKHKEKKQLHQLENQRTVVAYGDANFLSIKGHSPASVKKTLQAIAKKALVVLINEYKTPITCSTCHNPLDNVYSSEDFKCEHILTAFIIIEKEQLKYPLKLCPSCSDGTKTLFWNRDVNAAINIRDVLMYYINSGFNVDSLRHNKN
ncbi:hypothetical protein K501DRAFT_273169 [Backusella circina FSU 941]|nr:hypothetical protein K501DRAFT_273169 [Backusella circina FSU 941]